MHKTAFICQNCGSRFPKWQGYCPDCDQWNSVIEERIDLKNTANLKGNSQQFLYKPSISPLSISEVEYKDGERLKTVGEFDRVLGGGLVKGGVVLVGGAPGIGKSTLLLQVSAHLSRHNGKILYVSGEESLSQVKLRADRLGIADDNLYLYYETNVSEIIRHVTNMMPAVIVVDSIQTLFAESLSSAPGSVGQVRECAAMLIHTAKITGTPLILVGHITKDGTLAGPRVLEHMVDTVLYFEGDGHLNYRLLRSVKNRFGGTHEVGMFTMETGGLMEVKNPSEFFLSERMKNSSGSVVVTVLEGYRPLLIEVQALVSRSYTGIPRRTVTGLDLNRVNVLIAVLEKRCKMSLGQSDIFMNVVGAVKVREPATDLGVAVAVASSFFDKQIASNLLVIGEIGLGGEVRAVAHLPARLREGKALGFSRIIIPQSQLPLSKEFDMEIIGTATINQALSQLKLDN